MSSPGGVPKDRGHHGFVLTIDRQRRIDRAVGPFLCWLLTLLHRLKGAEDPPHEVRRILVVVLSEMGALVLARPMFDRLRQRYPSATFFVLCSEQNYAVLNLLDLVPAEQVIVVRAGSLRAFALDSLRAVKRMRALRLDAVLDLELFARVSAIFAGVSGARMRVGFHRHTQEGLYRGDFMNRPVLYNPYRHIAQQFVTLADAIGSVTSPSAKAMTDATMPRLPPLLLTPGHSTAAHAKLVRASPSIAGRPLVFLCPGAGSLPLRAWPASSFVHVARDFTARGFAVGIVGPPGDHALADSIQAACCSALCVDLTGYTATVRELTVLLHF